MTPSKKEFYLIMTINYKITGLDNNGQDLIEDFSITVQ